MRLSQHSKAGLDHTTDTIRERRTVLGDRLDPSSPVAACVCLQWKQCNGHLARPHPTGPPPGFLLRSGRCLQVFHFGPQSIIGRFLPGQGGLKLSDLLPGLIGAHQRMNRKLAEADDQAKTDGSADQQEGALLRAGNPAQPQGRRRATSRSRPLGSEGVDEYRIQLAGLAHL